MLDLSRDGGVEDRVSCSFCGGCQAGLDFGCQAVLDLSRDRGGSYRVSCVLCGGCQAGLVFDFDLRVSQGICQAELVFGEPTEDREDGMDWADSVPESESEVEEEEGEEDEEGVGSFCF